MNPCGSKPVFPFVRALDEAVCFFFPPPTGRLIHGVVLIGGSADIGNIFLINDLFRSIGALFFVVSIENLIRIFCRLKEDLTVKLSMGPLS